MIGVVMAGGKGTRMDIPEEKLLLRYKKPTILHVIQAMQDSGCFSQIIALTSPNSPKTKKLLQSNNIETFDTSGTGYVEDLHSYIKTANDDVLVASGDMPFLDSQIIRDIVDSYDPKNIWTSILASARFLQSLNLSSDLNVVFENQKCCYTGISLVNARTISSLRQVRENYRIIDDKRVAFNLNTKQDYELLDAS